MILIAIDAYKLGNDMLNAPYRMFEHIRKPVKDKKLRKRLYLRHKTLSIVMYDRFMNGRL